MRSFLAIGALLLLVAGRPTAAQTHPAAKAASSAGGVPALGAELTAETAARVNADATEMANRTNADAGLQDQITQIQAALAGGQGSKARIVGTLRMDTLKEFPIYGFLVGASATVSSTGGGTYGRPDLKDAVFTKLPDPTSAELFEDIVTGRHVKAAVFTMPASEKLGSPPAPPYRLITLEDVLVTNSDMGAFDATESYSLNYAKICIKYFPETGSPSEVCYDQKLGK